MVDLLRGERVYLRPANAGFSERELHRRYAWSKDQDLQYWSGNIPSATTFSDFKRLLPQRDWPSDGRRRSFAILLPDLELIGMVSCYGIDWSTGTGELGVYIGERRHWNRGLGTDAVRTLLYHLFLDLNFEDVHLHTYDSNVRARRSYEKVGFVSRGTRRRFSPRAGYYRELRMSLDRRRFIACNGENRHSRLPVAGEHAELRSG